MTTLGTLLADLVTLENTVALNEEIVKCHEQMTKIQEDINVESTRLARVQAEVLSEMKHLEVEAIHLDFLQNEASAVHKRQFRSRLSILMDPARLYKTRQHMPPSVTPGAGTSTPAVGVVMPQLTQLISLDAV